MAGAPHEPLGFAEVTKALRGERGTGDARAGPPAQRASGPQQLPMAPPWCIGREREWTELTTILVDGDAAGGPPLAVVEGIAGVGKTTLALRWAHRHAAYFTDGQLYADLRGFDPHAAPARPETILRGFLLALRTDPNVFPPDLDTAAALYRSSVASRRMLIFLDNAWDADQVLPLLPGADSCAVVVTARRHLPALRLRGATSLRLAPLSPAGARQLLSRQLSEDLLEADFPATAAVIRRCGGLPLALALVASRIADNPSFPMSILADELREESTMLDAFNAGDDASDVRAVLSWSVASLGEATARTFRLLGLTPLAEFSTVTIACLLDRPLVEVEKHLRSLETANLVQRYQPHRFRVHDLVRAYATELLHTQETARYREEALHRVVDFHAAAARAADLLLYPHRIAPSPPRPPSGTERALPKDEQAALNWFDEEHQTLLTVQRTAMDALWHEAAWHMSHGLDTYQYRRGYSQENVATSQIGLAAAEATGSPRLRASALRQLGRAHTRAGELPQAEAALLEALAVETRAGSATGQAHAHHDLQRVYSLLGRHRSALDHATSALELYRLEGNPVGEAHSLNAQGRQHAQLRNFAAAETCCRTALELHTENDNPSGRVATLESLGYIALQTRRPREAATLYSDALALADEFRNHFARAELNENLATALEELGEHEAASRALHTAYELYAAQNRRHDADRVRARLAPDRDGT
ncbi:tetratricopeptide repeat protein [Amycolatopsis sp. NPDC026612]|uniref:tetratricopeptide repeat protein n=1 Tax=Amycolatopsis sp. NPDC026612 TaxID=3155466 RepID=UPI0033CBCD4C